ncbi:MAG: NAD(+) synthase [Desulfobacterales bacterium]
MASQSADGVIFGLSGGVDSTTLAALAVPALGAHRVQVMYLFERESSQLLATNAQRAADWLGIRLTRHSIDPAMEFSGIYDPPSMRITRRFGWINRVIHGMYKAVSGETVYLSSLRPKSIGFDRKWIEIIYTNVMGPVEKAFRARHIQRRHILEKTATERNLVLIGAANRSEWMVGWFVKDGVDDLPRQPLVGLYKTQLRQLASYLQLPPTIQSQAPSPDMMKGITDEFALGLPYRLIDLALDHLEGGITQEQLASHGVRRKDVERVRTMNALSAWKRSAHYPLPPVDGGPLGGYRRD